MLSVMFMQINRRVTKFCQLKLWGLVIMPHRVAPPPRLRVTTASYPDCIVTMQYLSPHVLNSAHALSTVL